MQQVSVFLGAAQSQETVVRMTALLTENTGRPDADLSGGNVNSIAQVIKDTTVEELHHSIL